VDGSSEQSAKLEKFGAGGSPKMWCGTWSGVCCKRTGVAEKRTEIREAVSSDLLKSGSQKDPVSQMSRTGFCHTKRKVFT
jgi:hypothetical protein